MNCPAGETTADPGQTLKSACYNPDPCHNIVCPDCELCRDGLCEKAPELDGEPCDDCNPYTRDDACDNGLCRGLSEIEWEEITCRNVREMGLRWEKRWDYLPLNYQLAWQDLGCRGGRDFDRKATPQPVLSDWEDLNER